MFNQRPVGPPSLRLHPTRPACPFLIRPTSEPVPPTPFPAPVFPPSFSRYQTLCRLNENFNQPTRDHKQPTTRNSKEDICSSSTATAPPPAAPAASSGGWAGSPAHRGRLVSSSSPSSLPRDSSSVSPRQSGSPRGESKGGVFVGGETAARAGGSSHGGGGGGGGTHGSDGSPGKRHIEFEVHLKNPQVSQRSVVLADCMSGPSNHLGANLWLRIIPNYRKRRQRPHTRCM